MHLNLYVRMYGSFGPLFMLMNSISCSRWLTSEKEAWISVSNIMLPLPFDTIWITTTNIVFDNFGWWFHTLLPKCSPKSITSRILPHLLFSLCTRTTLAHFFTISPIHCRQIQSVWLNISNPSQFFNVVKSSATAVSQCRGYSRTGFIWLCPCVMHWCLISR